MAKAFTDLSQRGQRILLSAFGSGPNIVNMLYHATGQEVVVRETLSPGDADADNQPTEWLVSPGDAAPRYALLTPSVFDRYEGTKIRVLVTDPWEIDFFTRVLPGPCSLIGARAPASETEFQMQQWAKRCKRERTTPAEPNPTEPDPTEPEVPGDYDDKIQGLLLRVSPFDMPSLLDDLRQQGRIDRWMVHKRHEANVMLSAAVQVGGLIHFLASPLTEEFQFDHTSGHLQGMALMEIIRQAMIASSHVIGVPQGWGMVLTSFHTDYHKYVDVAAPIVVRNASRVREELRATFRGLAKQPSTSRLGSCPGLPERPMLRWRPLDWNVAAVTCHMSSIKQQAPVLFLIVGIPCLVCITVHRLLTHPWPPHWVTLGLVGFLLGLAAC